jgi:hypothetical protein
MKKSGQRLMATRFRSLNEAGKLILPNHVGTHHALDGVTLRMRDQPRVCS